MIVHLLKYLIITYMTIILRYALLMLFPIVLNAQQRIISLEFNSTVFPKEIVFKVELKLHFVVIDVKTMQKEGRRTTSSKDVVFQQTSTNSVNWTISYNNDGNPIVKGSPQSMAFNFSKPVNISSDTMLRLVIFEGKIIRLRNGKVEAERPIMLRHQFQSDDTSYVFRLSQNETDKGISIEHIILTKQQFQDLLDGKAKITDMPVVNTAVSGSKKQ